MAIVINPYIPLASVADRDKYLALVRDVAHETQANESECLAYCWTYQAPDTESSTDAPAMVQGLEVYKTLEALTVTHRDSAPYKKMREVVAATALITFPKGGVPTYVPAGAGFLWKEGASETVTSEDYFVVVQYTAQGQGNVSRFLEEERLLSEELGSIDNVMAFWCFVPDAPGEEVPITIFVRLPSVRHYREVIQDRIRRFEAKVVSHSEITQTRFWEGQGFGFFRRSV